jgi:SNF2 family DNA or RNA helicase
MDLTFKLKPYQWQMKAIDMSFKQQNLALFAEMGTGKSGAVVNILRGRYGQNERLMRTIIFAPLVTLHNWKNEFAIHSHIKPEKVVVLTGNTSKDKLKKFKQHCEHTIDKDKIVVVNYEAVLNEELFYAIYNWCPEIMVLDESHYVKNHKAKRSKKILEMSLQAGHRYLLSGTPILNGVDDVFMQYKIMDHGATFGDNYFVFRQYYMKDENAAWAGRPSHFAKWVTRPDKYKELNDKIYKSAIRVTKEETLDLPPLVKKIMPVEMGKEQKKYYDQMQRDFITFVEEQEKKGVVVAELAITKAMRLQQIVTGFVATDDGQVIEIKNNPRLKAVEQLLQDLHVNHKVILWCSFRHNYKQLKEVCDKLKIKSVMLTGDMNGDQKAESIRAFNEEAETRVIIANRKAGGIGVNMVASDVSIVFSRNFSLEEELQSEARNYRGGSEIHDRILKIDLCAKDTIDEQVTSALSAKLDVSKNVIDLVRKQ